MTKNVPENPAVGLSRSSRGTAYECTRQDKDRITELEAQLRSANEKKEAAERQSQLEKEENTVLIEKCLDTRKGVSVLQSQYEGLMKTTIMFISQKIKGRSTPASAIEKGCVMFPRKEPSCSLSSTNDIAQCPKS
jgi:hypothetical protein